MALDGLDLCSILKLSHWVIKVTCCIGPKWSTSQMADGILKFMIGHLGLGSNVQLGLVDFKVL